MPNLDCGCKFKSTRYIEWRDEIMELKRLTVKNFRNFKEVKEIQLSNQNVIFGMNDVGKTNLLYALRFLLDRKIRKDGFRESDFFQKDTNLEIEITLELSLRDRKNRDTQHIISKVSGSRKQQELEKFYIQVKGIYDESEYLGVPNLYWGSVLEELEEIPQTGLFSELDKLFKIVYIDPTIDLETTFSRNRKKLFDQKRLSGDDIILSNEIQGLTDNVNEKISEMKVIQEFQHTLTEEYKTLKKEEIIIELKSEMAINGYFGDLIPYIKRDGDDKHYPTSGDGRKKILAYSLLNHLTKEFESNKIVVYLIEEPENSLHRSMQIALSKQLFENEVYDYFFLSTHSSELLYEMDDASLIRIYNEGRVNCSSYIYHVDEDYKEMKKELNRSLATALFAEKVLLIEGPSERILFEKVLEETFPTYELEGGYILEVDGIKFKPYYKVLRALDIITIVKTDNDLKAKRGNHTHFDLIGFNRCLELVGRNKKEFVEIDYSTLDENGKTVWMISDKDRLVKEEKRSIYQTEEPTAEYLENQDIYLSEIDLEHDLYEVVGSRMGEILNQTDPVGYLQNAKMLNMLKLTDGLTKEDCESIIEHGLFKALKRLVD